MFDALYIGATGMQAQQLNVDTIANNLANVNTVGFKKGRISFADLMVRQASQLTPASGETDSGVFGSAALARLGAGVGVSGLSKLFDMGDMKKTESAFDVAVEGDGFMEVLMPDGSSAYSRGGTLKVNKDGQLSTQAGYPLKPGLSVPESAQSLLIGVDGRVQVRVANQSTPVDIGQIELVRFSSPQGLLAQGDNLYRSTEATGEPIAGKPGEDGMGKVVQGFLEGSNVKMVEEMVNLMVAQRAYEASVKVVQASDEMLGMINALRK
jgi:flagellar basal-body rod protein FlgG